MNCKTANYYREHPMYIPWREEENEIIKINMEEKFLMLRNQIEAKRDEYCSPGIERQIDEALHEEGEKEDEMGEPEAEVDNEFEVFRVVLTLIFFRPSGKNRAKKLHSFSSHQNKFQTMNF
jgi:hypothetical protein